MSHNAYNFALDSTPGDGTPIIPINTNRIKMDLQVGICSKHNYPFKTSLIIQNLIHILQSQNTQMRNLNNVKQYEYSNRINTHQLFLTNISRRINKKSLRKSKKCISCMKKFPKFSR